MEDIPAVCLRCGYVFPSGVIGEKLSGLTVIGPDFRIPTTKSCPRCKGPSQFAPEGLSVEETITTILERERSAVDLKALLDATSEAIKNQMSHGEAVEAVDSRAPAFRGVSKRIPHSRAERYALLAMVAGFLQVFVTVAPSAVRIDGDGIDVFGANIIQIVRSY